MAQEKKEEEDKAPSQPSTLLFSSLVTSSNSHTQTRTRAHHNQTKIRFPQKCQLPIFPNKITVGFAGIDRYIIPTGRIDRVVVHTVSK